MYGLRWVKAYQFGFLRPEKTDWTSPFRTIEREEFSRNTDALEHVNVEGLIPKNEGGVLPASFFQATTEDVEYIVSLHNNIQRGSVYKLERSILQSQENDVGNVKRGLYCEQEILPHTSPNIEVNFLQDTRDMMDDDDASDVPCIDQL